MPRDSAHMCNNKRILNISNNSTLKHKQALHAVEDCRAAWVEFGKTIRNLTLAEAIAARNAAAKLRDPLPNAEIPGLIFMPPANATANFRTVYQLIQQANRICANG